MQNAQVVRSEPKSMVRDIEGLSKTDTNFTLVEKARG